MLSTTQLRELADSYRESDSVLSGVILALASARIVTEAFDTDVAEVSLLQFCVQNSKKISDLANRLDALDFFGNLPLDPTPN